MGGGPASKADALIIQVDNAIGENKNRFIFGVAALLVLFGWYRRVEIHMLVRGHTHDAQDATFGVMRSHFRKEGTVRLYSALKWLRRVCLDGR